MQRTRKAVHSPESVGQPGEREARWKLNNPCGGGRGQQAHRTETMPASRGGPAPTHGDRGPGRAGLQPEEPHRADLGAGLRCSFQRRMQPPSVGCRPLGMGTKVQGDT